ncbi:MAG TPA: hypothetical protein VGG33_14995, partial [Polyangia bacterium]
MRGPRSVSMLTASAVLFFSLAAAAAPEPVAPSSGVPGGTAKPPRFVIKAERGFIDDPVALSAKGGSLAVLLTDASSFARIDLIDLATGKPKRTIELGDPQRLFERIVFSDDGESVVLISRDAGSGRRSAQHYDGAGKAAGVVGPVTDFGIVRREGQRFLVAVNASTNAAGQNLAFTRHRINGLGRVGQARSVFISKGGELRDPPLKSASFIDGHSVVVGVSPGGYDKSGDVRVPDQAAAYDVLAGKLFFKSPIKDVMAWAASSELRRKFPGRSRFPILAPDNRLFELVDWLGRHAPIEMPVPLRYYDATTLVELEDAGSGSLFFSLTTDPLHPEALARRKKDPAFFDLYWVQASTEAS